MIHRADPAKDYNALQVTGGLERERERERGGGVRTALHCPALRCAAHWVCISLIRGALG